jgi:hypothetical protein
VNGEYERKKYKSFWQNSFRINNKHVGDFLGAVYVTFAFLLAKADLAL